MPAALQPGDRKLLIGAGLLFLVLVGFSMLVSPPTEPTTFYPSTYSAGSGGAKVAYLLLQELGYEVERWQRPGTELPRDPNGTVLILAQPTILPTEAERYALRTFVRAGGHLLATGKDAAKLIPLEGKLEGKFCGFDWSTYRAAIPSPLTRQAPEIVMEGQLCWEQSSFPPLAVYGDQDKTVVVSYTLGKGRVVWWAGSVPLTNSGIRLSDNLALFLNSIGPPEGVRILWDEYYHGHSSSLASYLGETPVPWGLAQLALIFLTVCATFARRSGPVRSAVTESRLSPLEFIETLGDLYHRAEAAAVAVRIAYQRFRFLLAKESGLHATANVQQLYTAASHRVGQTDPELFRILTRCERNLQAESLGNEEALFLIQALNDYARSLQLQPYRLEERR